MSKKTDRDGEWSAFAGMMISKGQKKQMQSWMKMKLCPICGQYPDVKISHIGTHGTAACKNNGNTVPCIRLDISFKRKASYEDKLDSIVNHWNNAVDIVTQKEKMLHECFDCEDDCDCDTCGEY